VHAEYSSKYEGRGAGSNAANTHAFGHESSASHDPRKSRHDMYSGSEELSQAREGGPADALLWSTTYDRTYYPPPDLRPYAQHLLRCKTTSGMTVDTLHGSVASGAHLLPVRAQAVKAGIAPGEGAVMPCYSAHMPVAPVAEHTSALHLQCQVSTPCAAPMARAR
jgi:hypothetical protein